MKPLCNGIKMIHARDHPISSQGHLMKQHLLQGSLYI